MQLYLVCCAQIVEVIREHRFYEKTFVVETRPAGERELTDRQRVSSAHMDECIHSCAGAGVSLQSAC